MIAPRCGSSEILRFAQGDDCDGISLEERLFLSEKCSLTGCFARIVSALLARQNLRPLPRTTVAHSPLPNLPAPPDS